MREIEVQYYDDMFNLIDIPKHKRKSHLFDCSVVCNMKSKLIDGVHYYIIENHNGLDMIGVLVYHHIGEYQNTFLLKSFYAVEIVESGKEFKNKEIYEALKELYKDGCKIEGAVYVNYSPRTTRGEIRLFTRATGYEADYDGYSLRPDTNENGYFSESKVFIKRYYDDMFNLIEADESTIIIGDHIRNLKFLLIDGVHYCINQNSLCRNIYISSTIEGRVFLQKGIQIIEGKPEIFEALKELYKDGAEHSNPTKSNTGDFVTKGELNLFERVTGVKIFPSLPGLLADISNKCYFLEKPREYNAEDF